MQENPPEEKDSGYLNFARKEALNSVDVSLTEELRMAAKRQQARQQEE